MMINQSDFFNSLHGIGINFFTGVPDSLLNDFCLYLTENMSDGHHIMAANEGNAIGIAVGHYLATGNIPLVYMQNSGIGNSTNPLLSLAHDSVYGIPMILLIGWRGDPEVNDHMQHKKQGELTPILMKEMDIPFEILDQENTVVEKFKWAFDKAKEISSPVALIVKKGILAEKVKKQTYPESELMNREEAISIILDTIGPDAVYLATTGRATRELHEQITKKGWSDPMEFLNVGAMGHLSSIALGISFAKPDKKIVVLDGDSAAIMHLGSLATIGRYPSSNLVHIVLDNEVNESVGGQPSAGITADLTKIAEACGYCTPVGPVFSALEVQNFLNLQPKGKKPSFMDLKIRQGIRKDMPKLQINHKEMKTQLMDRLK